MVDATLLCAHSAQRKTWNASAKTQERSYPNCRYIYRPQRGQEVQRDSQLTPNREPCLILIVCDLFELRYILIDIWKLNLKFLDKFNSLPFILPPRFRKHCWLEFVPRWGFTRCPLQEKWWISSKRWRPRQQDVLQCQRKSQRHCGVLLNGQKRFLVKIGSLPDLLPCINIYGATAIWKFLKLGEVRFQTVSDSPNLIQKVIKPKSSEFDHIFRTVDSSKPIFLTSRIGKLRVYDSSL